MKTIEVNQTQAPESGTNAHSTPVCAAHPRLDDPDPVAAQRAWDMMWKAQQEIEAERHKEKVINQQRYVELAGKINSGELHPGLLFNDRFELQCLRPLSEWIAEGIDAVANQPYLPYPALTPEEKTVVQSAIDRIRAFQTAGKPMSEAEDAAVVQPESDDVDVAEALDLVSQIVLGEIDPATLFDAEHNLQGPELFRQWMLPRGGIDPHPLLMPHNVDLIKQAGQRVFMARCGQTFRTPEEQSARTWLDHRKHVAQLEDVLNRLGTPHQRARYRAGLLRLHDEALPLLEDEVFAPIRSLNVPLYEEFTPEDVLTEVFGAGGFNRDFANPEGWLEGHAIMTDKPTEEERTLVEQIRAALPRCKVAIFRRRLGLEGGDGKMLFSCCRNRIEVRMPVEGRTVARSLRSPRGDYQA